MINDWILGLPVFGQTPRGMGQTWGKDSRYSPHKYSRVIKRARLGNPLQMEVLK